MAGSKSYIDKKNYVTFVLCPSNLTLANIIWEVKLQLRKSLYEITYRQVCRAFSWYGLVLLNSRTQAEHALRGKPVSSAPLWLYSVSVSRFLPSVSTLTFLQSGLWSGCTCQINPSSHNCFWSRALRQD